MNRGHAPWLLGIISLSLLLTLPVQGQVPAMAAAAHAPTPTAAATVAVAEATPTAQPENLDELPPVLPDLLHSYEPDSRGLLPPSPGLSRELGPEMASATQSDLPYRYYLFSIGAQAAVGQFNSPQAVAVAPDGSIYVADSDNHRIQHFGATGIFLNTWGSLGSGDGQFSHPYGVAVAADGTVYVADTYNHRIQRFSATGSYLDQWGSSGYGDGQFNQPYGVAVAADGTVYVADTVNNRIQRFSATGEYLGQWGTYGSGDGQFDKPRGVAVAGDGTVYVADSSNDRIQRFSATGSYLGQWGAYGYGDGAFRYPRGVGVAPDGTVYVADTDNHRIQRFSAVGGYLGQWGAYGSGDGQFNGPSGVAVAGDGTVYVAEAGTVYVADYNCRIQRFSATGSYLGQWGARGSGDGQFHQPHGVAVAADGTVYVADSYNHRIQRFSATGGYLGQWGAYGSGDGQFYYPGGVTVAADGTVYVADSYNDRIQRFSATGDYLGQWGAYGSGDGQFNGPSGVAAGDGTVYVADSYNHRIQRFSATGGYLGQWGDEGSGDGQFRGPWGVAVAADGTVYVAESWNHRIQRFSATGGYLGQWGAYGSGDGQFSYPRSVAAAADGTVYVADTSNGRIQRFSATGGYLGQWGARGSGDGRFNNPRGVAVAAGGTIYVADSGNYRIQAFGLAYPQTWRGEYFGNRWLAERPLLIRDETEIDFAWEDGSPDPVIPVEFFSSRWHRYVDLDRTGLYRFTLFIDDGGRLWVDDRLLIEEWRHPQVEWFSETLYLEAGYHRVRLEHYDYQGGASATLDIEYVDTTPSESSATSPSYANTSPVTVAWTASDDYAGVDSTGLWVKYGSTGTWAGTGLTQSGTSGSFSYAPTYGDGTYYFATVATDKAANVEAAPTGDGDTSSVYDIAAPASSASSAEYAPTNIPVAWTADDATSGVASVCLWAKFGSDGTWAGTGLTQDGTSGTFNYTPTSGEGHYYFATVAMDRAGNVAAAPSGDGDSSTLYDVTQPSSQVQVPELERASTVSLPWTAGDALSGVSSTALWVKVGFQGTWAATGLSQSGTAGTFVYAFTQGEGIYYFATVATDRAGNLEALPSGDGAGGCEYRFYRVFLPLTLRDYVCVFAGPWEQEPNNSYLEANGSIISGQGYYGYPDDVKDYFSFYMRESGDITIDLTGHSGADVQLQLFYQNNNDRKVYDAKDPYHIQYSGSPGWYYVYIYASGGYNSAASYTLRVTYP